jgi:hypothetical protein
LPTRAATALAVLLPLAVYAALLMLPPPPPFGFAVGHRFTWVLVAAGVLLALGLRRGGRPGASFALALLLALVALPLGALWQSGRSDGAVLGGLLPFSDANGYYICGRLLAQGEMLADFGFCSRRPLFVTLLGGLLALTGENLRLTLALLGAVVAVSLLVSALELRRTHGAVAASVYLLVLFAFYRWYVGTTLTEHLGLALGALGFALLWRAAARADLRLFLLGLLTLGLALNARAGAFFVLPAAALWAALAFAAPGRRVSWKAVALSLAAILAAFSANAALVRAVGRPDALFSNLSYHLYGLATGGDWTSASRAHPELRELDEPERVGRVYRLTAEAFRREPLCAVRTALKAWREFLGTSYPYSFLHSTAANRVFRALALAGLVVCVAKRREPTASLLLAMTGGVVASVPFATPWDVAWMRAYAATLGVTAALPAVAVAFAFRARDGAAAPPRLLPLLATGLGASCFLAPLGTRLLARPPQLDLAAPLGCAVPTYARVPPGSAVQVAPDAGTRSTTYSLASDDFRSGLGDVLSLYPGLGRELAAQPAPFVLLNVVTLPDHGQLFIVAPGNSLPRALDPAAGYAFCLEPARDEQARHYGVHRATALGAVRRRGR